jgi:hypothetical protein
VGGGADAVLSLDPTFSFSASSSAFLASACSNSSSPMSSLIPNAPCRGRLPDACLRAAVAELILADDARRAEVPRPPLLAGMFRADGESETGSGFMTVVGSCKRNDGIED